MYSVCKTAMKQIVYGIVATLHNLHWAPSSCPTPFQRNKFPSDFGGTRCHPLPDDHCYCWVPSSAKGMWGGTKDGGQHLTCLLAPWIPDNAQREPCWQSFQVGSTRETERATVNTLFSFSPTLSSFLEYKLPNRKSSHRVFFSSFLPVCIMYLCNPWRTMEADKSFNGARGVATQPCLNKTKGCNV